VKRVIVISGWAGSGKTTVSKRLAEKYGLRYLAGGYAFQQVVSAHGGADWWETEEGKQFVKDRESNLRIDAEVDKFLNREAEKGNLVMDCKAQPWLLKYGFKIWFDASRKVRAERVSKRSKVSVSDVLKQLKERDETDARIYETLYGFRLGPDKDVFDLIVNTDDLNQEQAFKKVDSAVSEYLANS